MGDDRKFSARSSNLLYILVDNIIMKQLSPTDFKGGTIKTGEAIGVLFYADWCPFCMAFKPKFEDVPLKGFELGLANISDDDNPLWEVFNVKRVPTIIIFKDGQPIWRRDSPPFVGLKKSDLKEMIQVLKT
jgi:thioredoxin 1